MYCKDVLRVQIHIAREADSIMQEKSEPTLVVRMSGANARHQKPKSILSVLYRLCRLASIDESLA